jgi:radical SAM protein with 4Fe4S-binding SPASM domain
MREGARVTDEPHEPVDRAAIMARPRPRRDLPIVEATARHADKAKRRLPLADHARPVDARWRPIYAVWEVTLACDLACRHCGSRAGHARPDELTTEEALDVVDQLAELGVMEVSLIGGEAYLREDWCEIVARIVERGMAALLTTGGRGLTRERAERAARAGLGSVSISVDGTEATHDRLRGLRGSYRAALAAMEVVRDVGIPVSANTQINRLSMHELPSVFETIAERGAHSWQIQITVPMGRAADEPDVILQPYDLLELFPILAALKERCREEDVLLWPGNNVGYFGPFETLLRGTTARGHMASCGAGRAGLGIESDGTLKGCPSLSTENWAGGSLREHRLKDLWERAAPLRYTRDRTVEDLWGYCRTCYYADVCRAGCTWTSEAIFGRPGNNPLCHHRALEHAKAGQRERIVQVAPAEGIPFDQGRFELVVELLEV